MKQHGNAGQIGKTLATLEESPKVGLIVSRSGTATVWQLFGITLALVLSAGRLLGDAPSQFVIFDNDFYGPASSDLQAAALLLTNPSVKVLGLTVVSGDGWRDEETAHTLRLLEILRREDVPVVRGATFPLINTQVRQQAWEKSFGVIPWKGVWNTKDGPFPNHGPGYGSARIYADSVAPRLGERKVNIVLDVDAKRFVKTFIKAMQWEPPK